MNSIVKLDLLDKARRHDRLTRLKGSAASPLVPRTGRILANGKLRVVLETVDGEAVVYAAVPVATWRFYREAPLMRLKARTQAPAPSPSDRVKHAIDAGLAALAELEQRAVALQSETELPIAAE